MEILDQKQESDNDEGSKSSRQFLTSNSPSSVDDPTSRIPTGGESTVDVSELSNTTDVDSNMTTSLVSSEGPKQVMRRTSSQRWNLMARELHEILQEEDVTSRTPLSNDISSSPQLDRKSSQNSISSWSMSEDLAQGNISNWDAETCVVLLRNPNVNNFSGLRKLMEMVQKSRNVEWMEEFLHHDGLDALFESIERLCAKSRTSIADALMQLECVLCIRAVMNMETGLQFLICNEIYTRKMAKALNSKNILVKKQLFELMSALCLYSQKGYDLTLDALHTYKVLKNKRYRFSLLINELREAEVEDYKVTLISFVNCLIIKATSCMERDMIRQEFIGLDIQQVIECLRASENTDLIIQLDTFDESYHEDSKELYEENSNPFHIFNQLFVKIRDTPLTNSLINLLANLSELKNDDEVTERVWSLLDRIGDRAARGKLTSTWAEAVMPNGNCKCNDIQMKTNHRRPFLLPPPEEQRIIPLEKEVDGFQVRPFPASSLPPDLLHDCENFSLCEEEDKDTLNSIKKVGTAVAVPPVLVKEIHAAETPKSNLKNAFLANCDITTDHLVENNTSDRSVNVKSKKTINQSEIISGKLDKMKQNKPGVVVTPSSHNSAELSGAKSQPKQYKKSTCNTPNSKRRARKRNQSNIKTQPVKLNLPQTPDTTVPIETLTLSDTNPSLFLDQSNSIVSLNQPIQPRDMSVPIPPTQPPKDILGSQSAHALPSSSVTFPSHLNSSYNPRLVTNDIPLPPSLPSYLHPIVIPLPPPLPSPGILLAPPKLSAGVPLPPPLLSLGIKLPFQLPLSSIPISTSFASKGIPVPPPLPSLGVPVAPSLSSLRIPAPPPLPSIGVPVPPPLPSIGVPVPPPLPSIGVPVPPPFPSNGIPLPPPFPSSKVPVCPPATSNGIPPPPPAFQGIPLPPPPKIPRVSTSLSFTSPPAPGAQCRLPTSASMESFHTNLPRPSSKMKHLNWSKVSKNGIENSVWKDVLQDLNDMSQATPNRLNFQKIEELFCQKSSSASTPKLLIKKASMEVSLLDSKKSMNVNIFLKQFKQPLPEVMAMIRECRSADLGSERLRGLLKVLPDDSEMTIVKEYSGDVSKLGKAEQFYRELSHVQSFQIRIQGMIQMVEMGPTMEGIEPQLNALISTCDNILGNKSIKDFFAVVLTLGNFINTGSYAGNALGFQLNAITKLWEVRANTPGMTLLHYVVMTATKEQLAFVSELEKLPQVVRLSVDGINNEVNILRQEITKLSNQLSKAHEEVIQHFKSHVDGAKKQVTKLEELLQTVEMYRIKLSKHFCEDESKFRIEDCLIIFHTLCVKIFESQKENEQRQKRDERRIQMEEVRLRQKKEPLSKEEKLRRKTISGPPPTAADADDCVVDRLLADIRRGDFKLRKSTESTANEMTTV